MIPPEVFEIAAEPFPMPLHLVELRAGHRRSGIPVRSIRDLAVRKVGDDCQPLRIVAGIRIDAIDDGRSCG
jgi:hypothetical protein